MRFALCRLALTSGVRFAIRVLQVASELVDLSFSLVFGNSVTLLDFAGQLIALATNHRQVVIGEFAPLGFNFTSVLLPLTFHLIPIHDSLPDCSTWISQLLFSFVSVGWQEKSRTPFMKQQTKDRKHRVIPWY